MLVRQRTPFQFDMENENPVLHSSALSEETIGTEQFHTRDQGNTALPSAFENGSMKPKKTTTILSLPDEPIRLIFSFLKANDCNGVFETPIDAFALAQTNKRLLGIFCEHLTHITPDLTNSFPPTLSPTHLLSVARLAGEHLREIHLIGCKDTLPILSKVCPKLEVLSMVDAPSSSKEGLSDLLCLSLRSLSVTRPTVECLRPLVPPPQELCLYEIRNECYSAVLPILEQPPSKLNLTFDNKKNNSFNCPSFTRLRDSLSDAIPKIESAFIKIITDEEEQERYRISQGAERLVRAVRKNDECSKCRSIKLEGEQTFGFLKKVHPQASVTVSCWGQTYADTGDGIFAKEIPLRQSFVSVDVSRVERVRIESFTLPQWKKKLSNLRLKYALIDGLYIPDGLLPSVEMVEIPFRGLSESSWRCVKGARRVRILGSRDHIMVGELIFIFAYLKELLDKFKGESVWIGETELFPVSVSGLGETSRRLLRAVRQSVIRFEERGGEAGTVKDMTCRVMKQWVMDP